MFAFYLLLIPLFAGCDAANILGLAFIPSFSHQTVYQPIWRELSLRGHKVTTISSFLLNDPALTNLTEIDVSKETIAAQAQFNVNTWGSTEENQTAKMDDFMRVTDAIFDAFFSAPQVREFFQDKSKKFDLVISEISYPLAFAPMEHYNCPVVGISSYVLPESMLVEYGQAIHPIAYPDVFLSNGKALNLKERISAFLFKVFVDVYVIALRPHFNAQIEKYFPENKKGSGEIFRSASLNIMTYNPALEVVRPHSPMIIPVTGLNIRDEKPLPKDIKEFLDNSNDGAIYLSFGTNIKSALLPKERLDCILGAIAELPYNVLWKFEKDDLPNKPKNVMIVKWAPQQDILRHPNIKLFVTHAGLQSIEEATHLGVPMLAIPFFGDQPGNAMKIARAEIGLHLDYFTMTKETFRDAMIEIAGNKKYKEKALYYKNLIDDKPMTDLNKAIWWIEYVIRHKGAEHLRPHVLSVPHYQYFMLDIIGVLAIGGFLVVYLFVKLTKFLLTTTRYI